MEAVLETEDTLISKLQSSTDLTGLHQLFVSHLRPFTPFFKPAAAAAVKKPVRSSKSKPPDEASSIRSLAKQFLTLIHKSLSFLPKRLSENPKIPKESALELFSIYRLCLDCLELIVPELAGRPYSVLVQRLRYVHCLELWESYEEAEAEGFAVLESFNAFLRGGLKGNSRKSKTGLIPQLSEGIVDKDVAPIIMEVVVTLVKCVSKRMSKVGDDYWRVISLVHESEPWFKILDAKDYEKFHRFLETNLHIITLFLVAEIKSFSLNLIREFSLITFKEYLNSSSNDQMYKVAHKVCSSLFSRRDELSSEIILGVWVHVMDFVSSECEVGKEKTISEFLELVYYCASKFYGTTMSLCFPVAEHLYKLADTFYEDFQVMSYVLRLYGTGLLASSSHYQLKGENIAKSRSVLFAPGLQVLLDDKEKLNQVAIAINLLDRHIASGGKGKNSLKKSSLLYLSFWEALKFLSQSLAESIYLSRKEIFSVSETASMKDNLSIIYNVFHQFCHIFLQCLSPTEREKETSGENYRVISVVVVAAFMLSFKTNRNIKESTILVKQLISAEWIPIKRLKYLYVSLNNIAVILNRKKQLKEARKSLKLCCNASWNYVVNLCKLHGEKSHESHDDLSETAIADFVVEASEKVVFLVELSRECNSKLNGIITESLKGWCVAENLIATLPIPSRLIKEWVKIQYLLSKDADTEHGTLLYSLIPSSKEMSKRAHGKILEEELLAYDEKSYLNMSYSLRIRMKIIDILLEEVHVTKDGNLKKSRILIEKGKVLRAHGLAQLSECIQCLSDAIVTLKSIYSTKKSCSSEVHYLLICAYIQHALRIHEASPNMVASSPEWCNFLQDIDAALKLFLSPDHDHADKDDKDLLYLWHQLIDLLSIKGYLEIHPSLFDAVIKSCNKKNLPLAKTMSELWKSKRLSHALCASPVNDKFIRTFSNYQDQLFSSLEFWRMFTKELKPLVVGLHHTHDEIKQAASDLIRLAPQTSHSIFLSSSLYYELSERLISGGQIIEALTYAKEAHHLRSKLLQQKFEYSVEKMTEAFDEDGKVIEKSYYSVKTFKISDMEATKDLGCHEDYSLTPWNVLSCYLESILQVGFVQEILGNVSEAEMLLRWGRNVSQFQALPLFEIAFSSMLGKLCRKLKLWSIAEKELSCAKNSLAVNCGLISCKRCYSMLEISISQEIGDLFLSSSCSTGRLPLSKGLCDAKILYKSALDMLNHSEEARIEHVIYKQKSLSGCTTKNVENDNHLPNDKSKTKIEPRRSRRTKKEMKPALQNQEMACGHNRRITRSAHRSLGAAHEIVLDDRPSCSSFSSTTGNLCSTSDDGFDHTVTDSDSKCPPAYFGLAITTLCNKMKCWHCLNIEAVDFSNLSDFIYINWELLYRRLCLRLLISIGKICGICDGAHEAHEILSLSISVLFNKNSPCSRHPMSSLVCLIESIGRDFPGDLLATERAALIYYMSWFTLKSYPNQGSRNFCCELSRIGSTRVVMWLKMSFILCQEVPLLFQKVSRLLAATYVLSSSLKQFSFSPSEEGSESQWASFFHQASLGTHLNQNIISGMMQKHQSLVAKDSEKMRMRFWTSDRIYLELNYLGLHSDISASICQFDLAKSLVSLNFDNQDISFPNSASTIPALPDLLRPAPQSSEDLDTFVHKFFLGLPSTPIVCISFVTGPDATLLGELLHCSSTVRAWILLSHLSSDNQQTVLLPIYRILEASDDDVSSSSAVLSCKDSVKQWHCPWVSSVIDDIAPLFRHVLEGNYYSSSDYFLQYIKDNTSLWWMQRNKLNECLSKFLQDMEDLWLGPWKSLLLGEWPDCSCLDSIQKNLSEDDAHFLEPAATKKCYVDLRLRESSQSSAQVENKIESLFERMLEISDNSQEVECMNQGPIILVLDFEVQMLPWENLPILRNREVYRMPSVGSIVSTLERCCQNQLQPMIMNSALPLIDPLDSYYLLNPDGDLSRTQVQFENWFKDQNMEGIIGTVPSVDELTRALKSHDLFIYFGHGSGTQYIPGHEIQKLDSCAASLLLGCSSGCLYLKGCYMPQGAPISYLFAGSPVIIANLWEVTDKDIDRFGKAMLNAWLEERSTECAECSGRKSAKCIHRRRIASFMGQARDACALRFLIGAAPVCYGVPTGIVKRKNV